MKSCCWLLLSILLPCGDGLAQTILKSELPSRADSLYKASSRPLPSLPVQPVIMDQAVLARILEASLKANGLNKVVLKAPFLVAGNVQRLDSIRQLIENAEQDRFSQVLDKNPASALKDVRVPQRWNGYASKADSLVDLGKRTKSRQWPPQLGESKRTLDSLREAHLKARQALLKLPVLPSSTLKSSLLPYLDSLRNQTLAVQKLKVAEDQLSDTYKEVSVKAKQSLMKRAFFEGLVGVSGNLQSLTFSPSVGIPLARKVSAGIGLNVAADTRNFSGNTLIGFRSFAKYALLDRKLSLQVENNMYYSRFSTQTPGSDNSTGMKYLVYAGAEYLLRFSTTKYLNLTVLYQLNPNQRLPYVYSPLVVRLGMSVFKTPKPL